MLRTGDPHQVRAVVREPGVAIDIEFEAFLDVGHDPDHERAVLWCGGEEEHAKERTDGDFDHRDFLTNRVPDAS